MNERSFARRVLQRLAGNPMLTAAQRAVLDKYQIPPAHVAPNFPYLAMSLPDGVDLDTALDQLEAAGLLLGEVRKVYLSGVSPDMWD